MILRHTQNVLVKYKVETDQTGLKAPNFLRRSASEVEAWENFNPDEIPIPLTERYEQQLLSAKKDVGQSLQEKIELLNLKLILNQPN